MLSKNTVLVIYTTLTQNIKTVWIESLYANFPYMSGQSGIF